ncbi:MAG: DinB family protein [Gemmatimonadales bacterium]
MTAATASATAIEVESFRLQARMARDTVGANVHGLTHEDSVIEPRPGGNSLNWILGHLVWAYEQALPLLGQDPVLRKGELDRYARGAPGLASPAEAVNFDQLTAAWSEAVERVDKGLAGLTADVLEQKAPGSPTKNPNETVRSLVNTILFHQAYHAGQTGVLRRIAGKSGAIT